MLHLTQNLFHKNRHMRTISLNSHYMIVFKNPRGAGQFSILAQQMYLSVFKFAEEAYRDATEMQQRIERADTSRSTRVST